MKTMKAKQKARKWVKERIKRHPGPWIVLRGPESAHCWQGEMSIFMESQQDGWKGWFPIDDVDITDSVE